MIIINNNVYKYSICFNIYFLYLFKFVLLKNQFALLLFI